MSNKNESLLTQSSMLSEQCAICDVSLMVDKLSDYDDVTKLLVSCASHFLTYRKFDHVTNFGYEDPRQIFAYVACHVSEIVARASDFPAVTLFFCFTCFPASVSYYSAFFRTW